MADGWMDWLIEWLIIVSRGDSSTNYGLMDWFVGGLRGMSPEGLVLYLTPA